MIFAETLRHFSQEWIEIKHPKNLDAWPWDREKSLWLINLYPVSAGDALQERPGPFISLLIDNVEEDGLVDPSRSIYQSYFTSQNFLLPRKYVFDPLNHGEKNFKTNRYSFASDFYGDLSTRWDKEDLKLLRILSARPHLRLSIYNSEEYRLLRGRMDWIERHADGFPVSSAENLFDCTSYAASIKPQSPELMLIGAPILGLLKPVKKSKDYRVINGALVLSREPVRMALEDEPCAQEYRKLQVPFQTLGKNRCNLGTGGTNQANAVVFIAAEVPCGSFVFQEYLPGQNVKTTVAPKEYTRMATHHFTIYPETNGVELEVRLKQTIIEGLIPNIKENKQFTVKQNVKLFHRADMPDGFIKSRGGTSVTYCFNNGD